MRKKAAGYAAVLIVASNILLAVSDVKGWGVISEVALSEKGEDWNSWIEIFVTAPDPVYLCGTVIFHEGHMSYSTHRRRIAYTFPAGTLVFPGDYLLIHFNSEEEDGYDEGNIRKFFSPYALNTSWGLTDTQGAFVLASAGSVIWEDPWSDFIPFMASDRIENESVVFHSASAYADASERGLWFPVPEDSWTNSDFKNNLAASPNSAGWSLQRINNPADGLPQNTGTKEDWHIKPVNPGSGYYHIPPAEDILEVRDTPFFPRGDGKPEKAVISISNEKETLRRATVSVFCVNGVMVNRLLLYEVMDPGETRSFSWDGRDETGMVLPIGVYIVHLVLECGSGGINTVKQAPVVVGRRF